MYRDVDGASRGLAMHDARVDAFLEGVTSAVISRLTERHCRTQYNRFQTCVQRQPQVTLWIKVCHTCLFSVLFLARDILRNSWLMTSRRVQGRMTDTSGKANACSLRGGT